MCPILSQTEEKSPTGPARQEQGAIYTRTEVAEFILDLVGYTPNKKLFEKRLLEPCFGEGAFLVAAVDRLIKSWQKHARHTNVLASLSSALRAVELRQYPYEVTRLLIIERVCEGGIARTLAHQLADAWLQKGDYLLCDDLPDFDFVVGNPPYVRQERIPDERMAIYRKRYATIVGRSDLYIPFVEMSLNRLAKNGTLGFICSDRWTKNKYGAHLRQMIADGFHLKIYVDMTDTNAFQSDVIAYPAITIIKKQKQKKTRLARKPAIQKTALASLSRQLTAASLKDNTAISELSGIVVGAEPWILTRPNQLRLIRRLERDYPSLEEAGCTVGIGVATGADKAFIAPYASLNVEPSRKLPLVMTQDIRDDEVQWRGFGIINPFAADGSLVQLQSYPKLKYYLNKRREPLTKRYIARKSPGRWYGTIDRIHPGLAGQEKLLIPDIKDNAHIVYEKGYLYPHHNLYYITSSDWELRALQRVMMSGIARLFVSAYSTHMKGGYMRYQAQYLRRIRIPNWQSVPTHIRRILSDASGSYNPLEGNKAVCELYRLTAEEVVVLSRLYR